MADALARVGAAGMIIAGLLRFLGCDANPGSGAAICPAGNRFWDRQGPARRCGVVALADPPVGGGRRPLVRSLGAGASRCHAGLAAKVRGRNGHGAPTGDDRATVARRLPPDPCR
jgi:hypothetical protein